MLHDAISAVDMQGAARPHTPARCPASVVAPGRECGAPGSSSAPVCTAVPTPSMGQVLTPLAGRDTQTRGVLAPVHALGACFAKT